ncbi:hypothetical protein KQY30_20050 [Streptomyces sp. GMY02]|uniref:hypothetical protein n=1 Tax=Streptomyces sp. GMY02 TaxID=1333528 RepID=UPI001C2C645F|nr:hypothetical protein [Streptomyces sp. GMY02]QXE36193.1 hypothetical protein KQY30_20050 [Streptomyces sp. GMY02]
MNLRPLAEPLHDGSLILALRLTAWVTEPKYRDLPDDAPKNAKPELDKRAPLKRLALLGAGGYLILASDYTTYAVAAGTVAWVTGAWAIGYRELLDDQDEEGHVDTVTPEPEKGFADTETPEPVSTVVDTPPPDPRAVFARWLIQTIGPRTGIHLYELYPAMRQLPGHKGHDDARLRAALTTLRITITRSLRVGDVEGRSGVRLADLAPLLPRDGEEPLSTDGDAGQTADSPDGEQPESRGEHAGERVESA